MFNKKILIFLSFLLIIQLTSAITTINITQENSNQSGTNGNWGFPEYLFDGDWGTFTSWSSDTGIAYANYSFLSGYILNNITWKVKDYNGNRSLNIPETCINTSDKLRLKFSLNTDGNPQSNWTCWNFSGNKWQQLYISSIFQNKIYEEHIIWNIYSIPTINITSPQNNTKISSNTNSFLFNTTDTYGLKNITLYLWNYDNTINQTNYTTITGNTNVSNLSLYILDGNYTFGFLVFNDMNNSNWSENRTITIDTTPPNLNIVFPSDYQSFNFKTNININYTISDNGVGLDSCWWSNSSGASNYTITCGNNITVSESADGTYAVTIWSNDTLNNIANKTIHYIISQDAPSITKNYPTNNKYFNYLNNIYFNFTATDSNDLDTCQLWGNWTGTWHKNYTWVYPNSGIMNYTILNLTEGTYKYNIWCNDTTNSATFSSTNFTFTTDITYPIVSNLSVSTTTGSQTIGVSFNSSDINLNTCKYSIFNSSGEIDGSYNNVSTTCNSQISPNPVVSKFGSYNITVYAIDYSGNENSSTLSFTVSDNTVSPSAGGGGGFLQNTTIVYLKNLSWSMSTESNTNSYDLQMTVLVSNKKELYFINNGPDNINLNISCEGTLCKYMKFNNSLYVPINTKIRTVLPIEISIPREAQNTSYTANIIAVDQFKRGQVVTISVKLGGLGYISYVIDKIFLSSKYVGKIPIPNFIIFLLLIGFIGSFLYFIILYKVPLGGFISYFSAFVISGIVIYFI